MGYVTPGELENLNCIGYRGSTLSQAFTRTKAFLNGFQKLPDSFGDVYAMYYKETNLGAGDMFPPSCQCVTPVLDYATIFPNDTSITESWIFIVYVDTGFNTFERQQMDAWKALTHNWTNLERDASPIELAEATWPLGAQEFATDAIPGKHVLGCVRCTKTWNHPTKWGLGGTYTLHEPLFVNNLHGPTGLLTQVRKDRALKKVLKRLAFRPNGNIPMTNT